MADAVEVVDGAPVVAPMKKGQAQKITKQIRDAVESVPDLLLQAFEGQAHTALGYEKWADYVTAEFTMTPSVSYRSMSAAVAARELTEVTGVPVASSQVSQRAARAAGIRLDQQEPTETWTRFVAEAREAVESTDDPDERARILQERIFQAAVPVTRASRDDASEVRPSVPTWLKPVWPDVERAAAFTGANPFEFVLKSLSALIGQMDLPASEAPVEKPARTRRARQSRPGAAQEGDRDGSLEAVPEGSDPFAPAV